MEKIRCKLNINSLKDVGSAIRVEMGAVYSSRPDDPNKVFATATPCAFFSMDISKAAPAAHAPWLVPGSVVNVDLSLAEIPEWNWYPDRLPEVGRKVEVRLNSLEADAKVGIFRRAIDQKLNADWGNKQEFPLLEVEGAQEPVKLYTETRDWLQYFWKYVD